jgi:hypothetical protein
LIHNEESKNLDFEIGKLKSCFLVVYKTGDTDTYLGFEISRSQSGLIICGDSLFE